MRTTIDLPDPLFRELKAVAAKRGTSLKNVSARRWKKRSGRGKPRLDSRLAGPGFAASRSCADVQQLDQLDPVRDSLLPRDPNGIAAAAHERAGDGERCVVIT